MGDNGGNQTSELGLSDPTPQTNQKKTPKRRRYRRSNSAPSAITNGNGSLQRSESMFRKLHSLHPSFMQVAVFLAVYLGVGTICFYLLRHQIKGEKTNGVLDAVYFCIVTMATVGYGDLVPNSVATKLLACAYVFTGMALVGLTLSKSADYLVEKQEILLVKALHKEEKVGKTAKPKKVKHKFFVVLILLLVLIFVGTIFLALVEEMNIVDAFYCVCSTITTLGYGDKSFSTQAGRVFAVFWILTSTICLALFFLYAAELKTESKQRKLVKRILTRRMSKLDLEAADLDGDGVVGEAEFIIYKLQEMGKISQEDILLVKNEFKFRDVD